MAGEITLIKCLPCPFCGKTSTVEVDAEGIDRYRAGALVTDAFPNLTADQRELLITGIDDACWKKEIVSHES